MIALNVQMFRKVFNSLSLDVTNIYVQFNLIQLSHRRYGRMSFLVTICLFMTIRIQLMSNLPIVVKKGDMLMRSFELSQSSVFDSSFEFLEP